MTTAGEDARLSRAVKPEDAAEYWAMYQKPIIIGVIVAFALGGGIWMYRRSGQIREERGSAAYQNAEAVFMSGNKQLAQTELEKVVTRYKGTSAGAQAAMLMAQTLFEQGKADSGIVQLQAAARNAPRAMRAGIIALEAAGHEQAGKPADAAAAYGRAAAAAEFQLDKDLYRMDQARALLAAGDAAGARVIYEEIGGREDSPFATEAKLRLGEVAVRG